MFPWEWTLTENSCDWKSWIWKHFSRFPFVKLFKFLLFFLRSRAIKTKAELMDVDALNVEKTCLKCSSRNLMKIMRRTFYQRCAERLTDETNLHGDFKCSLNQWDFWINIRPSLLNISLCASQGPRETKQNRNNEENHNNIFSFKKA